MSSSRSARPGISARVEILIDELPDTIAVPIQAVFAAEGRFFCYVLADGEPERRTIRPGRSNDSFVEILELPRLHRPEKRSKPEKTKRKRGIFATR